MAADSGSGNGTRDWGRVASGSATSNRPTTPPGARQHIVVIGINSYRAWSPLHNAVADARGALDAFRALGFSVFRELFDDEATGSALRRLVTGDLRALGKDDSLVLFFAGHGHTETTEFADGPPATAGYLIPVDGDEPASGRMDSWLNVRSWLSDVAHLPMRHILVILDACHSGVALDATMRWRGEEMRIDDGWERLHARRSRRVITSALGDQRALDTGPLPGHSLFTGCLIEALTGGLAARHGDSVVTGTEIGLHVQRRVTRYPGWKQTPDFGALELDNRGELLVKLRTERPEPRVIRHGLGGTQLRAHPRAMKPWREDRPGSRTGSNPEISIPAIELPEPPSRGGDPALRTEGLLLDPSFVASLDRHATERGRGVQVLSVLVGEHVPTLTAWGTWSAGHGRLTLVTERCASVDDAARDLLSQMPWLRCLAPARALLAEAAGIDVDEVDASLDARSGRERRMWIDNLARVGRAAQVSAWLLAALRESSSGAPELGAAPAQGPELLSILCRLAAPFTVIVHHSQATPAWVERAIQLAPSLLQYLPDHAVALGAPAPVLGRVLKAAPESAAISLARQGMIRVPEGAQHVAGRARDRTVRVLHDALEADPRTRGRFELDARLPLPEGPAVEVDLVARSARLAVELDGWYHFPDPHGHKTERIKSARRQSAGFFVMRFLSEDVDERVALVVDQIAIGLGSRRMAAPHRGGSL